MRLSKRASLDSIRKFLPVLICVVVALLANASEEDLEYRHDVMEAIGYHSSALRAILEQKVPHRDHIKIHVNAIADLASITHTLFPEGSQGGEALDAIWEEPEEFRAAVDRFAEAAQELRDAVNAGEQEGMPRKIMAMFQACKGCHDDYRE